MLMKPLVLIGHKANPAEMRGMKKLSWGENSAMIMFYSSLIHILKFIVQDVKSQDWL